MFTKLEIAVFAGGCFWCTEAVFEKLRGVQAVVSGYAGGNIDNPTYKQVCSGLTNHAQVIWIEFDPKQITFDHLLQVFFATHDPTTLNRQMYDVGTQYRSAIFYINEEQKRQAESFIKQLEQEQIFNNPIVTSLEPLTKFYKAEDYHKNYYERNQEQGYCQIIISPKMQKFRQKFADFIKD